MATVGVVDSKVITISIGGTVIGCGNQANFTVNVGAREIVCKDTGDFKEFLPGLKDWSVTGGGLFAFDHTLGGMDLAALPLTPTGPEVTVTWGSAETGDSVIEGDGILTSLSLEAGAVGENATYSFTIQGSGAYTISVNV